MADVARAAGVSTATASRVMSGARPVTVETSRAVLAAAERIGYRINPIARSLRTQSTQSAGLIVPNLTNPFFGALAQTLAGELARRGWHMLIADPGEDEGCQADRLDWLQDHRVEAVMIIPESGATPREFRLSVPLIQIDRWLPIEGSAVVRTDDTAGIRMLVNHLRRDRSRFAFVGARPGSSSARLRLEAFLGEVGDDRPVLLGDYSAAWGREAADRLCSEGLEVDAIVCANDLIALGVIQVLLARGIRVPDTVAVTGFDDIVFAELSHPALTTVRQPVRGLAEAAVSLTIGMARGEQEGGREVVLVPELIVRASAPGLPA